MHLPPVGAPASEGVSGHCQPASVWQVDEHPSPDCVLPSSQVSPGSTTPLPQTQTFTQGLSGVVQAYPGSTWHTPEQPSPGTELPSSHVSGGSTTPSPHTAPSKQDAPVHASLTGWLVSGSPASEMSEGPSPAVPSASPSTDASGSSPP